MQTLVALAGAVALAIAMIAFPATTAHADPLAGSMVVQAKVAADGTVMIIETITFEGTPPDQLVQKLERRENVAGDLQYRFDYTDVVAKQSDDTAIVAPISADRDFVTVTVPTAGMSGPVVISYTVTGAAVQQSDGGTQLRLLLLQGLSVPVRTFTGMVEVPGQFTQLSCVAGAPGTDLKCKTAQGGTFETAAPTFTDGPRGIGEIVLAKISFPVGVVTVNENLEHRWTVGRAFSAGLPQLLEALALLVIGGLAVFALHRRGGVDAHSDTVTRVAEFAPIGDRTSQFTALNGIHPGHVGTLIDERVDPIDITASLLNLAVRGHLVITEQPTAEFSRSDWTLARVENTGDDLAPFETNLLDAVAPVGSNTTVSQLAGNVGEQIDSIQGALYDEVVQRGWYDHRPDETRNTWSQGAIITLILGVALTGVLAAFTTFGLLGLAVIIVGLGLMYVAQEMPARTKQGVAVLRGLEALRAELLAAPTDRMPEGQELAELSEVLPYAVVLGGADRWLDAIVAADDDESADPTDLSWYHGPDNWHLRNLPDSLRNFVTTVSGLLFSR